MEYDRHVLSVHVYLLRSVSVSQHRDCFGYGHDTLHSRTSRVFSRSHEAGFRSLVSGTCARSAVAKAAGRLLALLTAVDDDAGLLFDSFDLGLAVGLG